MHRLYALILLVGTLLGLTLLAPITSMDMAVVLTKLLYAGLLLSIGTLFMYYFINTHVPIEQIIRDNPQGTAIFMGLVYVSIAIALGGVPDVGPGY